MNFSQMHKKSGIVVVYNISLEWQAEGKQTIL